MLAVCHLASMLPPHMVPEEDHDALRREFSSYQLDDDTSLPPYIPGTTRLDSYWGAMALLRDGGGVLRFAILAKVMLAFVIIPISNAASERAFSMVRKIETDFRSELAQDTTCSLLSTKMNSDVRPSLFVPSVQVLRAAKRATLDYNTTHSAAAK